MQKFVSFDILNIFNRGIQVSEIRIFLVEMCFRKSSGRSFAVLLCILLFNSSLLLAQEYTQTEINAGYIYTIANHITWKSENKSITYGIGVLGSDEEYKQICNVLRNKKIKEKSFVIVQIKSIQNIPRTHILYISEDYCSSLAEIQKELKDQTLLISDHCDSYEHIMINFLDLDMNSSNKFQVNVKNILFADLSISRSIVNLGGGNEANWQELVLSIDQKLEETKSKLLKYEEEIALQQKILQERSLILKEKEGMISKSEQDIISSNKELEKKRMEIDLHKKKLEDLTIKIDEQESKLDKQSVKIERQQYVLLLFIAFLVFIVCISILIYRGYKNKKKANTLLEEKNRTINKQKDDIYDKSLVLKNQNDELHQQKKEIQNQAEQLHTAYTQLKGLEDFKTQITGMIVHDLKNPLNTIISFSSSEFGTNSMAEINQAGKLMLGLVMNILDTQKFEETKMQLDRADSNVHYLVDETLKNVQLLIQSKSLTVRINIDQCVFVYVDGEIIVRVLTNLLTNAIKYSPANEQIVIACTPHISDISMVCISVTDYGKGIKKEMIDKVFDSFAQIDEMKSGSVKSTGIGLTFCKMAVEAHGGSIWVVSGVYEGRNKTCFSFTVPIGVGSTDYELSEREEPDSQEVYQINFTVHEIDMIKPFGLDLKNMESYKVTKNLELISRIRGAIDTSISVDQWLNEMESAVYELNGQKIGYLVSFLVE